MSENVGFYSVLTEQNRARSRSRNAWLNIPGCVDVHVNSAGALVLYGDSNTIVAFAPGTWSRVMRNDFLDAHLSHEDGP